MKLREWNSRRRAIVDLFYEKMFAAYRCGPFDGGCAIVANALHQVIGGDIMVLTRDTDGTADHAVVLKDGLLWDFDGPRRPAEFVRRYERMELCLRSWGCDGYRPIVEGDLPDAPRDPVLETELAELFASMLDGCSIVQESVNGPAPRIR